MLECNINDTAYCSEIRIQKRSVAIDSNGISKEEEKAHEKT